MKLTLRELRMRVQDEHGPTEPDLPWLKGPWIVAFGIVGTALGLLAGFGSTLGAVLFVGYVAVAVTLLGITMVKRRAGDR